MQMDTAARAYINELKAENESLKINNKNLKTNNEQLKTNIIELNHYKNKYLVLEEQYALLLFKRFGRSAEQLREEPNQPLLFNEETEVTTAAEKREEAQLQTITSYTRKKAGRKPLSDKLERRIKEIDLPESEKKCLCGATLSRIGEETSEKLHIIPQQIYVEKTVRPKYACRQCEGVETEGAAPTVRIAPVAPSILPRSIASPSLLSTIITYKFESHLPYNRQERLYEQIGADISRQDMSNWQHQVYDNLSPLFELLKTMVKNGPVLQMDETTVQVIGEEDRKDTQKSYMWLARGGPPDKTVIWYEYHPTRAAYNAKAFLAGYSGYLQTDGYKGYDTAVEGMSEIIHVGCFAHARRKFYEAAKVNKQSVSAQEGIKHIRKLYDIESALRSQLEEDKNIGKFLDDRKNKAEPVLNQFKIWLEKRKGDVPPSTLLGVAIHYSLTQWDKMSAYLQSPYLTPDNNACENAIRPFVLGRKNWLFCQSQEGARSSCGMYTLIETAKQNGLIPYQYLMTLFEKAPYTASTQDWEKLLPWNIFTP